MKQTYRIRQGNADVGQALVQREGLYYRICCTCRLTGDTAFRVYAYCGSQYIDLGILVPDKGNFCSCSRIPVKKFSEAEVSFIVLPANQETESKLLQVLPDKPFPYLSSLEQVHLRRQDEGFYVIIPDRQ